MIQFQQSALLERLELLCRSAINEPDPEKQATMTEEIRRIVDTLDKLRQASGLVALCRA